MEQNVSTAERQLNDWLQQLKDDPTFVWAEQALHGIPKVLRDDRLPLR